MMREFLPRYLSPDDPETEADRAHNLLLHEAATKGLVGLAAMVYLLVALFRAGRKSFTAEHAENAEISGGGSATSATSAVKGFFFETEGRILTAGFLAAALAWVVQGLVGFGWPAATALFWVAAAMVCPNRRGEVTSPLRGQWAAPLLVVLFAVANAGLAVAAYRADLTYAQGLRRMEAGEVEAALSACRSAHRAYPLSAEYLAGLGLLLHRVAGRTGDERQMLEAEGAMAGAVGMDPEDGRLWAWLGMVRAARYRATGDTTLALAAGRAYREAVGRVPRSPAVYVNLANLLVETGRGADAVRVCEEGVSRNPRSVELLTALGRAHQVRGEGEEAARAFRRALALGPASGAAHQALGRIAFERGDFEGAAEAYRAAAALEPGSAARQSDLGSALFKAGRYEEAGRAFREALRIDPGNTYAQGVLGAILARDSVRTRTADALMEVPRLSGEAVIDLRDPAHRRYLREGWSYTETWGTWGTGEASEVVFSLQGVADGSLTVRATALWDPDRAQTLGVFLNDRFLAQWAFTRPAWEWETFRVRAPASAFRRGANRLTFRYARSGPAAQEDRRPVAVAFERIALGPP
jgi:Flp pilus assembly protein TadD